MSLAYVFLTHLSSFVNSSATVCGNKICSQRFAVWDLQFFSFTCSNSLVQYWGPNITPSRFLMLLLTSLFYYLSAVLAHKKFIIYAMLQVNKFNWHRNSLVTKLLKVVVLHSNQNLLVTEQHLIQFFLDNLPLSIPSVLFLLIPVSIKNSCFSL